MSYLVFICEPDENGVYSIGDRYVNLKEYKNPYEREVDTFLCPACGAHQINNYYKCVLCGFDGKIIPCKDLNKFIEENKEKIDDLKENYGFK